MHCLINEADGGESTLTDGAALIEELKATRPDDYEILSTRRWVFFNRGPGIDHRFSAPIIDPLGGEGAPTSSGVLSRAGLPRYAGCRCG